MPAGDWSNTCKVRPLLFSFVFDGGSPPNITKVATQYLVVQPSGNEPQFNRVYTPAAPMPINQGLTAIQDAVLDIETYEGLSLG